MPFEVDGVDRSPDAPRQWVRTAQVDGVALVVVVRGKRPDEPVIELARSYNMPVLLTRYSLFVASGRLYMNGLRGLDGSW